MSQAVPVGLLFVASRETRLDQILVHVNKYFTSPYIIRANADRNQFLKL